MRKSGEKTGLWTDSSKWQRVGNIGCPLNVPQQNSLQRSLPSQEDNTCAGNFSQPRSPAALGLAQWAQKLPAPRAEVEVIHGSAM